MKVLGLGDNVADHYTHINTIYPGGCAYNFAMFSKMLGVDAAYLGIVGDDPAGTHVLRTARDEGVDTSRCRIYHGEAPRPAVRIEAGERIFVGCNTGGVWERPLLLDDDDLAYIRGFALVHTSLYSFIEPELGRLAATGVPLSFDFSDEAGDTFLEAHCPRVTFAILSCGQLTEAETEQRIRQVHAYGAPYVIATRGAHGSFFADGHTIHRHPAHLVEARDTMGAGDSFLTGFLLSYVGWLKGNDRDASADERHAAAERALEAAADFAAKVCMIDGSSGHGARFEAQPG